MTNSINRGARPLPGDTQQQDVVDTNSPDSTQTGPDLRIGRKARPLNQLLPATEKWIQALPGEVRPRALLPQFPRMANKLARAWDDPGKFCMYMDELLTDHRGARHGFPADVHNELSVLREYVEGRYPISKLLR
jgi:hypothetical protein